MDHADGLSSGKLPRAQAMGRAGACLIEQRRFRQRRCRCFARPPRGTACRAILAGATFRNERADAAAGSHASSGWIWIAACLNQLARLRLGQHECRQIGRIERRVRGVRTWHFRCAASCSS